MKKTQVLASLLAFGLLAGSIPVSANVSLAASSASSEAVKNEASTETTTIALSSTTPVYNSTGTTFTVTVTNPVSGTDYSDITLSYTFKSTTTELSKGTDYTVTDSSSSDDTLIYTVEITSSTYNVIGQSLNLSVADETNSITITSDAEISITNNTLTVNGTNSETVSDYLNNASSITLVYTNASNEKVTITEPLTSTQQTKATYAASDIFNEDGSINFSCAIFANGSSGTYALTMSSQGFSDVSATVGTVESDDSSSGYQIVIPEGLADGVYSATIYVDHDDDPDDGEQFTNYPITVAVTVENGTITNITVSGASGSDTQYTYRAQTGISSQISGNSAGTYDVDTVSTATCSSVAIIKAINAALQGEPVTTSMTLSEAIYDPDGTTFTVTITNPIDGVDYSNITLAYAVGKFSASLTADTDYTTSLVSESEDEIVYRVTVLNSTYNVEDNDYEHDEMTYNTIGQALDVSVNETTVGRVIIASSATVTLTCNELTLTGGNGETLADYLDSASELTLTYDDADGNAVSTTYTLQWAHDVEPDYTANDFFNSDGSVNFDCELFIYRTNGTYTITITNTGYNDVTGTVGVGAHSLIYHEAVDATCTEEGNIGYWSCSICGRNFDSEEATTELTDVTIATLDHTLGDWEVTKEATETETGTKVQKCTICGEIVNTETIAAMGTSTDSDSDTDSDSNNTTSSGSDSNSSSSTKSNSSTGMKTNSNASTSGSVQTGDNNPIELYAAAIFLALTGLATGLRKRFHR